MRDFSNPRVYVLSAHRECNTAHQNQAAHCELSCDLALAGVPFQECEGSYKGVKESAYIVSGCQHEGVVEALALHFAQDTYLCVAEHDRAAYLVNPVTKYHEHVGKLSYVGEEEPDSDSWTQVGGIYYTTVQVGKLSHLPTGL